MHLSGLSRPESEREMTLPKQQDGAEAPLGLPRSGFLRLSAILGPAGPIPVSKSTWWEGVRRGRYPAPVKLGPRITAWRVEDILKLIEHPSV